MSEKNQPLPPNSVLVDSEVRNEDSREEETDDPSVNHINDGLPAKLKKNNGRIDWNMVSKLISRKEDSVKTPGGLTPENIGDSKT